MRVPLSWLREFVPVEAPASEIAERLSLRALEVEQVEELGAGISGVVVAEVAAVRDHPNADNLVLVRASDGSTERPIVCGARNFAPGDRVALAAPGARLPNGMQIDVREFRGERSEGMLCSARELAVGDDHAGIMVLDPDVRLGADVVGELELADQVIELAITPNRPDALSIVGVAREVAALFDLPLTIPAARVDESEEDVAAAASVDIEDARGCPRYLARVIRGLRPGSSPWWMRRRLMAAGTRPISNIVDVTNYVLLERGHPLHAFDLTTLKGGRIVVRRPVRGETLTTLDDQERVLARGDVMICDAERPVAVAGIMGGAETEVSAETTDVLLESAYFDPIRITRTARRLGLRTEASVRFERGADSEAVAPAAARACELLASVAAGTVLRGAIDVYPRPKRRKAIRLRPRRAGALIGIEQDPAWMARSLRSLGCEVEQTRSSLRVTPPTFRPDLTIEEDLVEELARLYGYDRIPETLPAGGRIGGLSATQHRRRRLATLLAETGLLEAQTLSLLPEGALDALALPDGHPWTRIARIANPLSEEEVVLRPCLLRGLLAAAARNTAREALPVHLFELGVTFAPNDGAIDETERVAWVLAGTAPASWHTEERALDYFDAKGVLERITTGLGVALDGVVAAGDPGMPWHPVRCADIVIEGRVVGRIGELHPRIGAALDLPGRVAVAELDAPPLLGAPVGEGPRSVPRFPSVKRDVAVVVADDVPSAEVAETIREAGGTLLETMELFDVYRGDPVPQDHVSLAYGLVFRDLDRTLTDADAEDVMASVAGAIAARGWTIRD